MGDCNEWRIGESYGSTRMLNRSAAVLSEDDELAQAQATSMRAAIPAALWEELKHAQVIEADASAPRAA
ncbi:hypothetical protein [Xanthomonas arboricola]|uniref:hypothetical protein n=1 Tax=Xanthomonas arboricola TaxID=56448 RepID=UPI003D160715